MTHDVEIRAEPIADAIVVRCKCGWRDSIDLWSVDQQAAWNAAYMLKRKHLAEHEEAQT